MRLQIYVPQAQADKWSPDEISFGELQKQLVSLAGGITITSATGHWHGSDGYVERPVFIVEALVASDEYTASIGSLLRTYAETLLRQGEESVLIVQDNEPTIIT